MVVSPKSAHCHQGEGGTLSLIIRPGLHLHTQIPKHSPRQETAGCPEGLPGRPTASGGRCSPNAAERSVSQRVPLPVARASVMKTQLCVKDGPRVGGEAVGGGCSGNREPGKRHVFQNLLR